MNKPETWNLLEHWSAIIDDNNLAWLYIQTAGKSVNILTHSVMNELAIIIDGLESITNLKGVALLSGKSGGFVYGADVHEFETITTSKDVANHMRIWHGLFNRPQNISAPTCVGIGGIAVGGGLEIALPFDRLFVTNSNKTKLGFPEVNLGIMPGYGGSGRAYGRVGTKVVLDMMVSGRPIGSKQAIKVGLADEMVDTNDDLATAMKRWILSCNDVKPIRTQLESEANDIAIADAKDKYLSRVRSDHTAAPFTIIDHVQAFGHDSAAM